MIKFVAFSLVIAGLTACRAAVPYQNSADFAAASKSFYVGLAAMQAADDRRAKTELENAVKLAPGEPAAWTNLGILQMRQKEFDASEASLEKARNLFGQNGRIYRNIYILEAQRGNFDKGVEALRAAVEIDRNDVRSQFGLGREFERKNDDAGAVKSYAMVAAAIPENIPVRLEIARLAAKSGDTRLLNSSLEPVMKESRVWEPAIQSKVNELLDLANAGKPREAIQSISFLRNMLMRLPRFRSQLADIRFDDTVIGEPFDRPLFLPSPNAKPAEPDLNLKVTQGLISDEKARWCKAVYLDGETAAAAWANDNTVHVGDRTIGIAAANDVTPLDIDYNFKNDLVVTGDKGVRFFNDSLSEITASTKLPPQLLSRKYLRAYAFDVDIDGDLDLILAAETGPPAVLQNNGDGTFLEITLFGEIDGLRDLTFGDLDEDGDVDVATVDAQGTIRVYFNDRGGRFSPKNTNVPTKAVAITIADTDGDSKLDINFVASDGTIGRTTARNSNSGWAASTIANADPIIRARLVVEDLDNNGAFDLMVSGQIFLAGSDGNFHKITIEQGAIIGSAAGSATNGRFTLVGLNAGGQPTQFTYSGEKNYGWQTIRPRSAKAEGDQRVNSFGIGGEMEIRAGLLNQKHVIDSPQIHFGLGDQSNVDLLRIIWGNGFSQAEFDLTQNASVQVGQRLTGSCPQLFAWNGSEFKFVKDAAPLGTSLGLRVSKDQTLPVTQTEEWYKIPGESLVPRNGYYEIRITDELWEAYYVDHYHLLVVDHPAETEVFANELYPIPSPPVLNTTGATHSFASAIDDKGNDVAATIRNLDENYLGGFEMSGYQGVTKEHYVEMVLPADAPTDRPITIIADGWLHPSDTSLNVAISQNSAEKPKTLSLDALDSNGNWVNVKGDFGVPASKFKTILAELPAGTKRCRLRTNSEVYWDKIAWAVASPDETNRVTRLDLATAELRYHGFSAVTKRDDVSPEIPNYNSIATTTERWRTIEGYYTRFGDILELLTRPDDRYVLVASGDEMILRFREIEPIRDGWKRDFIIIGDGWIKEGDYNNEFSQTVLPLPTRRSSNYSRRPTTLEDDPVFKEHSADWQNFHWRYVAPDRYNNALNTK